jgi:hypothetical protein
MMIHWPWQVPRILTGILDSALHAGDYIRFFLKKKQKLINQRIACGFVATLKLISLSYVHTVPGGKVKCKSVKKWRELWPAATSNGDTGLGDSSLRLA